MKQIVLIGIPSDLGANVEGSRFGPGAIREYLISALKKKGYKFQDHGDIAVPQRPKKTDSHKQNFKEILEVSARLKKLKINLDKEFPLFFGGDHSVEDGIMGLLTKKKKLGLAWFDAHADFNNIKTSQESPWGGGHIHGMVLAEIVGHALIRYGHKKPKVAETNVALIGLRDVDASERVNLYKSRILHYTMEELRTQSMERLMIRAIHRLSLKTDGYHVTIDVDGLDPKIAPAVSTPVPKGITKQEIKAALSFLSMGKMSSLDFVEFNPLHDKRGKTAKLITELTLHTLNCLEKNGVSFARARGHKHQ